MNKIISVLCVVCLLTVATTYAAGPQADRWQKQRFKEGNRDFKQGIKEKMGKFHAFGTVWRVLTNPLHAIGESKISKQDDGTYKVSNSDDAMMVSAIFPKMPEQRKGDANMAHYVVMMPKARMAYSFIDIKDRAQQGFSQHDAAAAWDALMKRYDVLKQKGFTVTPMTVEHSAPSPSTYGLYDREVWYQISRGKQTMQTAERVIMTEKGLIIAQVLGHQLIPEPNNCTACGAAAFLHNVAIGPVNVAEAEPENGDQDQDQDSSEDFDFSDMLVE